jgi:hypothetical protein
VERLAQLLCFAAILGASSASYAQQAASQPNAVALTISGGVSLGTYQAGYLYFASEYFKRSGREDGLRLITGASAGAINGFITALNTCQPPIQNPDEDTGYKLWMDLDFDLLFDANDITSVSMFSRNRLFLATKGMRKLWHRGMREGCDLVLGIAATRLFTHPIRISGDFFIPRQEEKFVFRLRGRGLGVSPKIDNYVDTHSHLEQPLIPFKASPDHADGNFERVLGLLFATSAYPIAFAPEPVGYCMSDPQKDGDAPCESADRFDFFVDGGVFDNRPLRLSKAATDLGLRWSDEHGAHWRDLAEKDESDRVPDVDFVYLDPDTTAYPPFRDEDDSPENLNLLPYIGKMLTGFVESARAKELYALVQASPKLGTQMRLTERYYPTVSRHIAAFLGFFEEEFRFFDYYLGMYDAFRNLKSRVEGRDGSDNSELALFFDSEQVSRSWKPFACMLGWFEEQESSLKQHCEGEELYNFRILLQVSLDRLYAHCSEVDLAQLEKTYQHSYCERAAKGESVPRVVPLSTESIYKEDGESRLAHSLRLLAGYGFEFGDLGLGREDSHLGAAKLRRKMLKLIRGIAEKQEGSDRTLLLTAGRALVNEIAYEPPMNWFYATLGTGIEFGASLLPFDWNRSWMRLNLALQIKGADTLVTSKTNEVQLSPVVGIELEPLFMTTSVWQPILGFRGGFQFSNRDHFATQTCDEQGARDATNCSQFVFQHYWALSILERVRIQTTFEFLLEKDVFEKGVSEPSERPFTFDLVVGLGLHFF